LAVAYKIPTIISTFGGIVAKSFSVSVVENFDEEDKDGFLGQSFAVDSFLMVLCASGLMIMNVPLAKILFAKDFFAAWQIVPPLVVSALFNHLAANWECIYLAINRTKVISITALLGAAINTMLNICFIPYWEGYGAALATIVSLGSVWLIRYVLGRRYINLKNSRIKEPLSYVALLIQMILAYWGNRFLFQQIIVILFLVLLYKKEIVFAIGKMREKVIKQKRS